MIDNGPAGYGTMYYITWDEKCQGQSYSDDESLRIKAAIKDRYPAVLPPNGFKPPSCRS